MPFTERSRAVVRQLHEGHLDVGAPSAARPLPGGIGKNRAPDVAGRGGALMSDEPLAPPVDLRQALRLADDDPELLKDLGEEFRQKLPEHLGELRIALDGGDAETVQRVAHSLKGALAILAAGPAGRQALELEALGRSKQLGAARERLDALEREIRRVSDFLAVPGWSRRG
jgi:HPt (histidine-containing phosphotransfer) domain-containing protein